MIYTTLQLKAIILPMLQTMEPGGEALCCAAIVDLIKQDREAHAALR